MSYYEEDNTTKFLDEDLIKFIIYDTYYIDPYLGLDYYTNLP